MTFDNWMKARNPKYHPTDDTVALRELRECWQAAQKVGSGGTANKPMTKREMTMAAKHDSSCVGAFARARP